MTTQNSRDQEPDQHPDPRPDLYPDTEGEAPHDTDSQIDRDIEAEQDEYAARTRRALALGAAVVGVLVAIGAVLLVTGPGGHHAGLRDSPAPTSTVKATHTPPQVPAQRATPSPSPNTSPVISASPRPATPQPRVRWHGTLTLTGPSSDIDLDAVPPSINEQQADIFGAFLEPQIVAESDDVHLAVFHNPGHLLTYRQCRDSVTQSGLTRTPDLSPADVVCVKTTQGAIARLRITRGVQTSDNPIVSFTITIWKES